MDSNKFLWAAVCAVAIMIIVILYSITFNSAVERAAAPTPSIAKLISDDNGVRIYRVPTGYYGGHIYYAVGPNGGVALAVE